MRVKDGIRTQVSGIPRSHVINTTPSWPGKRVSVSVRWIWTWSPFHTLCCQGNLYGILGPLNKGQRKVRMSLVESRGKSSELTNLVFLPDLSPSPVDFASQTDLCISGHLQAPSFICLDNSYCHRTLCFHSC